MTGDVAIAQLSQGDSGLAALPGLWGGWVTLFCLCPAPSRAAPPGLGVSCCVWTALNEVHLEELGFWGWFFLLWGDSW